MKEKETKGKSLLKNKTVRAVTACVLLACIVIAGVSAASGNGNGETTYRETAAVYGSLTVGVTESGTVEIGTVEQTFDLDMSELQRVTTNNSNSSSSSAASGGGFGGMAAPGGGSSGSSSGNKSGGSNDIFGQMFNMGNASSNTSSDSDSNLIVDSIAVSVGQSVSEGDVILTLESEGVEELKAELQENVEKASADLQALIADQKLSDITAEYTLKSAQSYGSYAAAEKSATIDSLSQNVTDASKTLEAAQKSLARYEEQLATAKTDYENAKAAYELGQSSCDSADKNNNLYAYVVTFNDTQTAKSTAENLEKKVEQLEEQVEMAQNNVTKSEASLAQAKRDYDAGVITANETYELKMLAYNTAQETYDITEGYLKSDLADQQKTYDETEEKWNEFTTHIDGLNVVSQYNGVITDISLAKGDKLTTGSVVITLYDADDVTMTVSVDESDMTDLEVNGLANIALTAYPDEVFEAYISDIGDASTDNSGNTTYEVTVTIKGDTSKLFQGMTGDVTFITKQISEVVYVNNRAIIRENGVSYVKVKDEKGNIQKVKVETGFSDGVNVEIKEGLEAGQTVLIEKGESA